MLFTDQRSLLEEMRKLELEITTERIELKIASLTLQPTLLEKIKTAQGESNEGKELVEAIKNGKRKELRLDEHGYIRFGNRLWVPPVKELRKEILNEAHASVYTVHPGSTKMYKDIKWNFW